MALHPAKINNEINDAVTYSVLMPSLKLIITVSSII